MGTQQIILGKWLGSQEKIHTVISFISSDFVCLCFVFQLLFRIEFPISFFGCISIRNRSDLQPEAEPES
jgi:hypothetical protein